MRTFLALLCSIALTLTAACSPSQSEGDVDVIETIDNAAGKLDEAFEAQDADAIKSLMTSDHLAVTPYYGAPQTGDEQIASLPDLKYEQTNLTVPSVAMLGPDVALRTFSAKLEGSYKGKPVSGSVFITEVMVKQDGVWRERFYQATELAP